MSTLMGLLAPQGERRSRSKSPGGRDRSRSRSNVREERSEPKRESERRRSSKKYSESESDSEQDVRMYRDNRSSTVSYTSDKRAPYRRSDSGSESDSRERRRDGNRSSKYGNVAPNIVTASPTSMAGSKVPYGQVNAYSYAAPAGHVPQPPGAFPDLPHGALSQTRHTSYIGSDPRYAAPPSAPAPGTEHYRQRAASSTGQQYAQVGQFQYAQIDPRIAHKDPSSSMNVYSAPAKPQVVTVDPRNSDPKKSERKYSDDRYASREEREKRYVDDKYRVHDRESDRKERIVTHEDDKHSARRLSRLSIGAATGAATLGVAAAAGHGSANGGGKPPASPLLEAYKGTYQSISPMPSALVLANHKFDSDISDVELDSGSSSFSDDDHDTKRRREIKRLEKERDLIHKKREKEPVEYERRRPTKAFMETRAPDDDTSLSVVSARSSRKSVSWYDAENDAKQIAAALKGSKPPNTKPLLQILPFLNMDDLDALKVEYKNHATIGGQGINMSKHIKARVTGHFGKAAYATSLGQYESDAYWANCFYQSGASRRELLIESLMGRTNQQIREIKNFFKDKKYDDDLEKCLKAELKADKFRTAILLALEERRQADSPMLDKRLIRHDVRDLYEALNSPGGESAMIQIIVVRSDAHMREVLRQYETEYGRNFARDMINKSKNLVGETLAHILNGALNRSMRDALLLHQAIAEMAPGKERAELLISRLVRLHWEPKHLEKVKAQYHSKYKIKIEDAIKRDIQFHMKTDEGIAWTNFCIALIRSSE